LQIVKMSMAKKRGCCVCASECVCVCVCVCVGLVIKSSFGNCVGVCVYM